MARQKRAEVRTSSERGTAPPIEIVQDFHFPEHVESLLSRETDCQKFAASSSFSFPLKIIPIPANRAIDELERRHYFGSTFRSVH
jgi:hypothetical protein